MLAPAAMLQRPDRTVADTIASVFRHAEYVRSTRDTIWSRVLRWIGSLLRRLFARSEDHPAGRTVAIVLLVALGAIVAGRLLYAAWREAELRGLRAGWRRDARGPAAADPWAAARAEAAAGRYVDAAHALYQALLAGLTDRARVRLHPSKTAGDYVRDLRGARSPLLPRFRDFARAYEVVAYGTGECDRARYERLLALAIATLGAGVPTAEVA